MVTYNNGHNILELYNILVQIQFTTSKRKLDIQYSKLCIRVASRVAERRKTQGLTKIKNTRKISNLGGHITCLVPSLFSRTYTLRIAVKKHAKSDTKLFFPCPILRDYSILFQIFCRGLQVATRQGDNFRLLNNTQKPVCPIDYLS